MSERVEEQLIAHLLAPDARIGYEIYNSIIDIQIGTVSIVFGILFFISIVPRLILKQFALQKFKCLTYKNDDSGKLYSYNGV